MGVILEFPTEPGSMTLGEFLLESGAPPARVNAIAAQFSEISNAVRQSPPEGEANPDGFRLLAAEGAIIKLLIQLDGLASP